MIRSLSLFASLSFLLSAASPASAQDDVGQQTLPVIYGDDDREEVFAHASQVFRDAAIEATVGIFGARSLDARGSGSVLVSSAPLGESLGLCDGQRFTEQPSAAFCSGTLIAPDLVLTAGHCVNGMESRCPTLRAAFDFYYESEGVLAPMSREDVYSCKRVVAVSYSESDIEVADFLVFQLDRPASDRVPVPVRSESTSLLVGTPLTMIGAPSGIPLKIDDGGAVLSSSADGGRYFAASTDSFAGNSGSAVYDAVSGALAGILIRGATDYVEQGACSVVNQCLEDGSDCGGGESILYSHHVVDAVCEEATDPDLCGTTSECGDGYCAFDEDATSCASDCTPPSCGDRICELAEWETCTDDCFSEPPAEWSCPESYYAAGDGCDCECGAVDPDCAFGDQQVFGCDGREVCSASGQCVAAPTSPPEDGGGCVVSGARSPVSSSGLALVFMGLGLRRLGSRRARARR